MLGHRAHVERANYHMLEISQASWRGWPISACILMLVNSLVRAAASVAETQVAFCRAHPYLAETCTWFAHGRGYDAHADFEHAWAGKAAQADGV